MSNRTDKILRILYKSDLDIHLLARKLKVSEVTVRRDLIDLENRHLIQRGHGMASITSQGKFFIEFECRRLANLPEKQRIAQAALEIIKPGHSIIIDTGTTALQFAGLLAERDPENVRVITSSLLALEVFKYTKNMEILVIGGIFRPERLIVSGGMAEKNLQEYHVDYAVISVDGISAKGGLMTVNMEAARFGRQMIASADKTIVLADHSKIGKNAFVKFAGPEEISMIITGKEADKNQIKELMETQLKIKQV